MKPRPILTLLSGACLLAAFGLVMTDSPVVRAAGGAQTLSPRDAQGRPLPAPQAAPQTAAERLNFLRSIQPMVGSGVLARKLAESLGLDRDGGKRFNRTRWHSEPGVRLSFETPVATDYIGVENTPSIAASPIDERIVVAAAQNDSSGNQECTVYVSFDGGLTYVESFDLPLLNPGDFCADPVVRATPAYAGNPPQATFSYFVFSYLSARPSGSPPPNDLTSDAQVLLTDGLNPAAVVSGPTTVAPSSLGFVDKGWIGVHTFDFADGNADGYNYMYFAATVFTPTSASTFDCSIIFSRSSAYGIDLSWSAPVALASSTGCTQLLQGPHVAAAPGQQVLVCYFDAGMDGLNIDGTTGGKFNIRCDSSKDRGVTFQSTGPILAAKDVSFELPRNLCPGIVGLGGNYHAIWTSMFPALDIDHLGNAHAVFAADPTTNKFDGECGNIFYLKSVYPNGSVAGANAYDKWAPKAAVGTGGRAQVFPTVVAQKTATQVKPIVYVAYADHSRGDLKTPNIAYDVKYRKSIAGGGSFAGPVLVTSQSSLSQYSTIGDYFDSSATNRRYHIIWTDRGDKTDINDYESDVFTRWY